MASEMTDARRWSDKRKAIARERSKRLVQEGGAGNEEWKALGKQERKVEPPVCLHLTVQDILRQPSKGHISAAKTMVK